MSLSDTHVSGSVHEWGGSWVGFGQFIVLIAWDKGFWANQYSSKVTFNAVRSSQNKIFLKQCQSPQSLILDSTAIYYSRQGMHNQADDGGACMWVNIYWGIYIDSPGGWMGGCWEGWGEVGLPPWEGWGELLGWKEVRISKGPAFWMNIYIYWYWRQ